MLTKIDAKIVTVIISENRMIEMNMKAAKTSFLLFIDTTSGAHLIAILKFLWFFGAYLIFFIFFTKVRLDNFDGSAATAVEILTIEQAEREPQILHWESRAHWENGSFDELPALIKLICYHLSAESFDKNSIRKFYDRL